jgi:hypothetical protein
MFAYTPNVETFSSTIHWNVAITKKLVLELCVLVQLSHKLGSKEGSFFNQTPRNSAFILFHVLVGPRNGAAAGCEAAPAIAGHARVPVGAECFFFDSPNGTKE